MSDRWYYQLLMEEFGPVSKEYVWELVCEGTLGENELVRKARGGDWMTISAMKEACQAAASSSETAIQEIQSLSELNFQFETSSSAPRRSTAANAPVQLARPDTPVVSEPSIPTRDSRVAARTEAPVRKRTAATVDAKQAAPVSRQQKPSVASGTRRRVVSDKETSKVGRSKRISSNGLGVDDELPDDVFKDVFQKQDTTSQRSLSARASMATAAVSPAFAGTAASRGAMGPPSSVTSHAGYSRGAGSSLTPVSALFSASPSLFAAPSGTAYTPPVKRSVSVSVSEPMDFKKIGMAGGAIVVIAGVLAISVFGLPIGGGAPQVPFDPKATAIVLNSIMKDFDTVAQNPSDAVWDESVYFAKSQLHAILVAANDAASDAASDAPEVVACSEASKALMKIADLKPAENEDVYLQFRQEFARHMAMVR